MAWFRSHLRLSGNVLALWAWLLLANHVCLDAGDVHAAIVPVESHGSAGSHDDHAATHSDCLSAISSAADLSHGRTPIASDAPPWHAVASTGIQAVPNGCGVDRPPDSALGRYGPSLFLLHSALLI